MWIRAWLAAIALAYFSSASAETAYVTDILRLGLHRAEDTSDAPFENLVSGTELEILRRTANYAEVTTEDGQRGWVKSAFIVAEKPARSILGEKDRQIAELRERLELADAATQHAQQQLDRYQRESELMTGSAETVSEALDRLRSENLEYVARLDSLRQSVPLNWALAALLCAFVGGGLTGAWALDAYIRRRHGGFRVY